MMETSWERKFLDLAEHVSGWSRDPNAKIGAVIVNQSNKVVALGFNGFPQNVEETENRLADKSMKNEMTVHAETNAIMTAGKAAEYGTIYVVGKPTCPACAGAIIQAGIRKVIAVLPESGTSSKWDRNGLIAQEMFAESGVEFIPHGSVK